MNFFEVTVWALIQRLSPLRIVPDLVELQTAGSSYILSKYQVDFLTQRAEGDSSQIISHRDAITMTNLLSVL
jgi:hypothetical protein